MASVSQELLNALGVQNQADLSSDQLAVVQQIESTLDQSYITSDQRDMLLSQLQQHVQSYNSQGFSPFGIGGVLWGAAKSLSSLTPGSEGALSTDVLNSLLGGLQQAAPQPTAAQQQAQQAAQVAQQAQIGGSQLAHQYGIPYPNTYDQNGNPTDNPQWGTPAVPQAIQQSDWDALSSFVGYNAQSAYNNYVAQKSQGLQQLSQQMSTSGVKGGQLAAERPMSATQWYQQQMQSIQGPYAPLFQAVDDYYQNLTGQGMPPDLEFQLLKQIKQMSPQESALLLDSMAQVGQELQAGTLQGTASATGTTGTSGATTAIGNTNNAVMTALQQLGFGSSTTSTGPLTPLYSSVSEYINAHPSQQEMLDTTTQQNISTFEYETGRPPTTQEIQEITGMDPTSLQKFTDSLPSPLPGVGLGQYHSIYSTVTSLYSKYGITGVPDNNLLTKMSGLNSQEQTDYFDDLPSKVKGLDNGQYNSYLTAFNPVQNGFFSSDLDAQAVADLHGKING